MTKQKTTTPGYHWCFHREFQIPFVAVVRPDKDQSRFEVASVHDVMPKNKFELHEVIIGSKLKNPFQVINLSKQDTSETFCFLHSSGNVKELSSVDVELALELFDAVKGFQGFMTASGCELAEAINKIKVMSS